MIIALAGCSLTRPTLTPDPGGTAGVTPTSGPQITNPASPGVSPAPPQITTQATPGSPPDSGKLIVVSTRGGELWRLRPGEPVRLAAGEVFMPRISPDGRTVAFLRQSDAFHQELWAVELDGSDERKLVGVVDLDKIGGGVRDPSALAINPFPEFDWIPGTRSLAFTTYQVFNGPGSGLLNDLHLVDADSFQVTNLFLKDWGGKFVFSPDGSQVVISQIDKIILANADGSQYRQVMSYQPVITYSEAPFFAEPLWSPAGDFLRVAIPPVDPLAALDQLTALWRIIPAETLPVQEGSVMPVPVVDSPVFYSPDLQRIAWIRETPQAEGMQRELHLATFDGEGDWVYASNPMLVFAAWAPDSRRFIYMTGENQDLMLGSLDDVARPVSADLSGAFDLRWVDGHRFIYLRRVAEAFEFALYDVDQERSVVLDTIVGARPTFDWWLP